MAGKWWHESNKARDYVCRVYIWKHGHACVPCIPLFRKYPSLLNLKRDRCDPPSLSLSDCSRPPKAFPFRSACVGSGACCRLRHVGLNIELCITDQMESIVYMTSSCNAQYVIAQVQVTEAYHSSVPECPDNLASRKRRGTFHLSRRQPYASGT